VFWPNGGGSCILEQAVAMTHENLTPETLARARVRVPDHVVSRVFDAETVALNLRTGQYHGLNPTAGRMLELLRETGSPARVAGTVAEESDYPVDEVARDLAELCKALADRGLVEIDVSDG
jgi:hypothetical protein